MKTIDKSLLNITLYVDRNKTQAFRIKEENGTDKDATVRDYLKIIVDSPQEKITRQISKTIDKIYEGLSVEDKDLILDDQDYDYLNKTIDKTEIKHKQIFDALARALDGVKEYRPD